MNDKRWKELVFNQGVSDFCHHKNTCPVYWRGTPDAKVWMDGFMSAKRMCR